MTGAPAPSFDRQRFSSLARVLDDRLFIDEFEKSPWYRTHLLTTAGALLILVALLFIVFFGMFNEFLFSVFGILSGLLIGSLTQIFSFTGLLGLALTGFALWLAGTYLLPLLMRLSQDQNSPIGRLIMLVLFIPGLIRELWREYVKPPAANASKEARISAAIFTHVALREGARGGPDLLPEVRAILGEPCEEPEMNRVFRVLERNALIQKRPRLDSQGRELEFLSLTETGMQLKNRFFPEPGDGTPSGQGLR